MAETDIFDSYGQHLSRQHNPAEKSRVLRIDANGHATAADSQVPVQSANKRFVTRSGSRVGNVEATNGRSTYRYNTSTKNPYQAQVQNARLQAVIAERAKKFRK